MRPLLRTLPLFGLLFFLTARISSAADTKAQPAVPPMAVPAFVDVVTFAAHVDGLNHKVVVTVSPDLQRIDEPDDRYSVIYDPQTQHYTGLEHANYTYWEFSWPDVRAAVETSKRYEAHLQELNNEGLSEDNPSPTTNAPDSTSAASPSTDDSGYVWRPTTDKKRIADLDCIRWTGDTVSGEHVDAWCYAGLLPKVQAAIQQLRTINEPMALVPVREVVPDFIFPVFDGLAKGGVTPVLITWGDEQEQNRFALVQMETHDGRASLFTVPKLYVRTTLITMDGMIEQPK
jgi:hypothetical protein